MNKITGMAGLAACVFGLTGGAMTARSATKLLKPPMADQAFVKKAAGSGMAEVELGKLAAQKGSKQEVKDFGQMMVDDHSKANDELMGIAKEKSIMLPTGLPPAEKKLQAKLMKLNGAAFDQAYIAAMVKDHKMDIADFTKASTSAKDPDIKGFATKTLPTLKTHLAAITSIQAGKGMPEHKM